MLSAFGALLSFPVIVYLIRKKVDFGISLLVGSFIIAIFSIDYLGFYGIFDAVSRTIIYSIDEHKLVTLTLELILIVNFINMLATIMKENRDMEKLVDSLGGFLSKGGIIASIPALFGLLPIQGGALFSAPLIEREGKEVGISKEDLSLLNVWFRHVLFLVYPLSATMILLSGFTGKNIYSIIFLQVPSFIMMILIGLALLNGCSPKKDLLRKKKEGNDLKGLLYFIPILLVVLVSVPLSVLLKFPSTGSLLISLLLGILSLLLIDKVPPKKIPHFIKEGLSPRFSLAIIGIMVFRELFSRSEITEFLKGLSHSNFPPFLLITLVPLLFGFSMGHNLVAVSLSYPILEPLFPSAGLDLTSLASLIYMSSFMGYLFSPVHLCVVVTCEYFKTDLWKMYKKFIPASLAVLAGHVTMLLALEAMT
ncbi:MAG: DUF401 family protein [Thermoplasmata archaeon]|nr:DUF401 family protein [Thermoplasmata archaeon]